MAFDQTCNLQRNVVIDYYEIRLPRKEIKITKDTSKSLAFWKNASYAVIFCHE